MPKFFSWLITESSYAHNIDRQPAPCGHLIHITDSFSITESVRPGRPARHIERRTGNHNLMAGNTGKLTEDNPKVFGTLRYFYPHKLFNSLDVSPVIMRRR